MRELQIPFEALRDQINCAVNVIVQIDRYADGARRLAEVAVVASSRREQFRLATVARFDTDPIGPDRRVAGAFPPLPAAARHRRAPAPLRRDGAGRVRPGTEAELSEAPVREANA